MNDASRDNDLRSAFQELRAEDACAARDFAASVAPRGSWRIRRGRVAAGLAAVVAAVSLAVLNTPNREASPLAGTPPVEGIAFDQLSAVIERELAVAKVSEWRSPTSFLLDQEY